MFTLKCLNCQYYKSSMTHFLGLADMNYVVKLLGALRVNHLTVLSKHITQLDYMGGMSADCRWNVSI